MNVKKLSKKVDGLTKDLDQRNSENSTLKKEVKDLREDIQSMATFGFPGMMGLPTTSEDSVDKALLVLGQLCWRIAALMYQRVLPNSYDSKNSYRVKYIEEDIEALEDKQEKDEAKKRWVALQKKLNWKKLRHTRAMKSVLDKRNVTAHPDLNEEELVRSTKAMEQDGKLTGWLSAECVNELIKMWKLLEQLQE